jgi:hypothetical protein
MEMADDSMRSMVYGVLCQYEEFRSTPGSKRRSDWMGGLCDKDERLKDHPFVISP